MKDLNIKCLPSLNASKCLQNQAVALLCSVEEDDIYLL